MKKLWLMIICTLAFAIYIFPAAAADKNCDEIKPVIQQSIIVNGEKLDDYPIIINNCVLVPMRSVSDKLGFTVTWNKDTQEATVQSDTMKCTMTIGEDLYSATSTIALGMTAPTEFGSAPLLINNRLYIPAEVFRLIQGNDPSAVKITDTQILLKNVSK